MESMKNGPIVFSCSTKEGITKSVSGSDYNELIERIEILQDGNLASRFYAEFKQNLNEDQISVLRSIVVNKGKYNDILNFFENEVDPSKESELIEALVKQIEVLQNSNLALAFYHDYRAYLNDKQVSRLRNIVLKQGTYDDLESFYYTESDPSKTNLYVERFLNFLIPEKFVYTVIDVPWGVNDCQNIEETIIQMDSDWYVFAGYYSYYSLKGELLARISVKPGFSKQRIVKKLIEINDIHTLLCYYYYYIYYKYPESPGVNLETIADLAIKSGSCSLIMFIAKYITMYSPELDEALRKLEKAFLEQCNEPKDLSHYLLNVKCSKKDKFLEKIMRSNDTKIILDTYNHIVGRREKKKIYQMVWDSGNREHIMAISEKTPLYNRMLWKIFRF